MRWMVSIAVVLLPSLVFAESLADAARREQERRQKNNKEAGVEARVIDQGDVAVHQDDDSSTSSSSSSTATSSSYDSPQSTAASSAPTAGGSQKAWQQRAEAARAHVAAAEKALDDANSKATRAWGAGSCEDESVKVVGADGKPGTPVTGDCQRLLNATRGGKQAVENAQRNLDAAKKALEALSDEAQRAGVPSSWVD